MTYIDRRLELEKMQEIVGLLKTLANMTISNERRQDIRDHVTYLQEIINEPYAAVRFICPEDWEDYDYKLAEDYDAAWVADRISEYANAEGSANNTWFNSYFHAHSEGWLVDTEEE